MSEGLRRLWESGEWQAFALKLVQLRHQGGQNVQPVPDAVKGDAGIEFFTTDGCLYQCYAPEEASDVAKAASAMKGKGRRDLSKLVKNQAVIASLLQTLKVKRWILLCPFLDDKSVIASIREKGEEIRSTSLPFLSPSFEALVQSQIDFQVELDQLRQQSLGPTIIAKMPSDEDLGVQSSNSLSITLRGKLAKAYPDLSEAALRKRQLNYLKSYMIRENIFEQMRRDHPALWEKSSVCIAAEEDRLATVGLNAALPNQQLIESLRNVEDLLDRDMRGLSRANLTQIAIGTVGEWLMRCPLNFED
jgi:hypothetical protein